MQNLESGQSFMHGVYIHDTFCTNVCKLKYIGIVDAEFNQVGLSAKLFDQAREMTAE